MEGDPDVFRVSDTFGVAFFDILKTEKGPDKGSSRGLYRPSPRSKVQSPKPKVGKEETSRRERLYNWLVGFVRFRSFSVG
jgi:hypothetical protein